MNFLLGFLKNPKLIFGGVAVLSLLGLGVYIVNLIGNNSQLEEQLSNTERQLQHSKYTLKKEREQFQSTISNYDELMSSYLEMLEESNQRTNRIEQTMNSLAQENEQLEQCFNLQAPKELTDQIFRGESE